MDSYECKNRIEEALNIRGMKQIELAEKSGISKGTINNWIKNKYQPKQKSLLVLARVLNVSEMWLAGYDVPMDRPVKQIEMDELAALINILRKNGKLKKLCMNIAQLDKNQYLIIENMVNELIKANSH